MYVCELAWVYMHHECARAHGDQKGALNPLEPISQKAVGVKNETQVLCKSWAISSVPIVDLFMI